MIGANVRQLLDNRIVVFDKEDYCFGNNFENHNYHCGTIIS